MSWDEKLFSVFYNFIFKSQKNQAGDISCLKLDDVRRQSEVLLSALCEKRIEIRDSSGWGGVSKNIVFLPESFHFINNFEDQVLYLEWRLLVASMDIEMKGMMHRSEQTFTFMRERFPKLDVHIERLKMHLNNKSLEAWFGSPIKVENHQDPMNPSNSFQLINSESLSKGTEIKGKTHDQAKRIKVQEKQDNPLTHVFEKVLTAEDYQGGQRKMDGSDELAEQGEALSELSLSQIIRTHQSAQSVLKSNAIIDSVDLDYQKEVVEKQQKIFYYPEWVERKKIYQKNWCTVLESQAATAQVPLPYNKKIATVLRQKIESTFNSYQWVTRQKEGPEVDLNLVVDRVVQMKVGGRISENIYQKKMKKSHDMAIQILVDTSLSTDSYALGKRIMDTTQEALNIFTNAFEGVLDSISIAAFSSYTRNKVHYSILKEFDEEWSQVPLKIAGLKPDGYTRIGPALRHSRARLEKLNVRKKMLLFISDAKPTDYDYYEGQHGISDIQRAVMELQASGCKIKVLTLTDQKQSHHNFVFGAFNCHVLKNVEELSDSLFHFWYLAHPYS